GADDASSRMCRRAAQEEPADRRAVAGPARRGPEEEELVERHRALEDVAARQREGALEVERRQYLPGEHRALEVGRVLVEQVEATISKALAFLVPGRAAQPVGRVLDEHRHEVLARRRDARIDDTRDRAFEQR